MKYNLLYNLAPATRAGLACLFISQLLSLALDHLAPVTVTFAIVVMGRRLLTHTTTCHITLRFLALRGHPRLPPNANRTNARYTHHGPQPH